jgi:hypothetical protein
MHISVTLQTCVNKCNSGPIEQLKTNSLVDDFEDPEKLMICQAIKRRIRAL